MVADIPGLIEGAAEGAGLGHQFLRHLQRTRLLWHVVDVAPMDEAVDPVRQAKAVLAELRKYDELLYRKPRWLVLNKIDMIPQEQRESLLREFAKRMRSRAPIFVMSALTRDGLKALLDATWAHVDAARTPRADPPDARFPPADTADAQ